MTLSSLHEWMIEHDCEWVKTVPGRSDKEPARHFVRYIGGPLKDCRIDPVGLVNGDKESPDGVFVENHPVHWQYDVMPRYWRERVFPHNFIHWTEAEHPAKRSGFTWCDQQTIWEHRDAWEAWIDGGMDLEATRAYIASLPALPTGPSLQNVVRLKRIPAGRRPPTLTPEQEQALLDALPRIPEANP